MVIAAVVRRDNGHKLQAGRLQLDVKKIEDLPKASTTLEQMTYERWNL